MSMNALKNIVNALKNVVMPFLTSRVRHRKKSQKLVNNLCLNITMWI